MSATYGIFQTVKEASQSLRPQAQRKWKSFSPAACTSEKIPLGSQTCALCAVSAQCVRCREPQPFQTKAQRSGFRLRACQKHFFDKPKRLPRENRGADAFCAEKSGYPRSPVCYKYRSSASRALSQPARARLMSSATSPVHSGAPGRTRRRGSSPLCQRSITLRYCARAFFTLSSHER